MIDPTKKMKTSTEAILNAGALEKRNKQLEKKNESLSKQLLAAKKGNSAAGGRGATNKDTSTLLTPEVISPTLLVVVSIFYRQ